MRFYSCAKANDKLQLEGIPLPGAGGDYPDKIHQQQGNRRFPSVPLLNGQAPHILTIGLTLIHPSISTKTTPEYIMDSKPTGNLSIGMLWLSVWFKLMLNEISDGIHVDMDHLKKGEVK